MYFSLFEQFSSIDTPVSIEFPVPNLDFFCRCLTLVFFYRSHQEEMIKEERFSREGKMMVDRRFLVRLCGILLGVGILMSMASLCSSHGHAHDHHGHAHDHHGHAHDHHGHSHEEKPSFKYSRQANIKEDDHHDHHDHGHHGHTHDHHGHAHDHHGHSHEQKSSSKYSKEANVKEAPKPVRF